MHRRRALAVVLAALIALVVAPVVFLSSAGTARAQTSGCSYPVDNCSTTTTVTPSTTPGNTTTTTTFPGCNGNNQNNPHCTTTTTTPGNTTTSTTFPGCNGNNQ